MLPPRSNGKPEAATAVDKLLIMGMRMPETCWTLFKRQAIKLRDWCIWLVDLFQYMMMHGLTNLLSSALSMHKKKSSVRKRNLTVNCGGRTALNFTDWTLKMCSVLRTKRLRNCGVFCYVLSMSKHNYSKATHSCATVCISLTCRMLWSYC
jgi:hypothetical protein